MSKIILEGNEIAKPVKGFEDRYIITNHGRLFSINGKWKGIHGMKPTIDSAGYYIFGLRKKPIKKYVRLHRLLAEHFIPNPKNKREVNHKDGNKLNNNLTNLEWVTSLENSQHAVASGLFDFKGSKHWQSKLTEQDIPKIFEMRKSGMIMKDIGNYFGVSRRTIGDVLNRNLWTHVSL